MPQIQYFTCPTPDCRGFVEYNADSAWAGGRCDSCGIPFGWDAIYELKKQGAPAVRDEPIGKRRDDDTSREVRETEQVSTVPGMQGVHGRRCIECGKSLKDGPHASKSVFCSDGCQKIGWVKDLRRLLLIIGAPIFALVFGLLLGNWAFWLIAGVAALFALVFRKLSFGFNGRTVLVAVCFFTAAIGAFGHSDAADQRRGDADVAAAAARDATHKRQIVENHNRRLAYDKAHPAEVAKKRAAARAERALRERRARIAAAARAARSAVRLASEEAAQTAAAERDGKLRQHEADELAAALSDTYFHRTVISGKVARFYMDGHIYIDVLTKYQQAELYRIADNGWRRLYLSDHGSIDDDVKAWIYDENTDELLWEP